MAQIDHSSISRNSVYAKKIEDQSRVYPVAVSSIQRQADVNKSRAIFDFDLDLLTVGNWQLILPVNAAYDADGRTVIREEVIYSFPVLSAISTQVTAEYVSGLGASATSPADPNALASVSGPVRVKFKSTEIA